MSSRSTDDVGGRSDTRRAESFSDGVLAIVITLLVLDLRVPGARRGHLLSGLLAQWPSYAAYVASYLYVAVVWLNHKAAFSRLAEVDRGFQWANLSVLFSTALLPFPTAIVAHALREGSQPDQRAAIAFYSLISALLSACWLALYHYLTRHPDLVRDGIDSRFFAAERLRALVGIILYVIAGLLGYLVVPFIGLVFFLVLPAFYGITSSGLYQAPIARRLTNRSPPPPA